MAEESKTEQQEDIDPAVPEAATEVEEGEGAAAAPQVPKTEYDALNDKYVRLYAEFENFRRRTAKENFELMATANAKLIGRLTDVLDDYSLAFDPKHKTEKLEDFEKGMRMIHQKFREILDAEGLEEIDPQGQEFDPNMHEALMQQPSDTVPDNHVAQVYQKGYKLKSKILKHAKVIISTGKPE